MIPDLLGIELSEKLELYNYDTLDEVMHLMASNPLPEKISNKLLFIPTTVHETGIADFYNCMIENNYTSLDELLLMAKNNPRPCKHKSRDIFYRDKTNERRAMYVTVCKRCHEEIDYFPCLY